MNKQIEVKNGSDAKGELLTLPLHAKLVNCILHPFIFVCIYL